MNLRSVNPVVGCALALPALLSVLLLLLTGCKTVHREEQQTMSLHHMAAAEFRRCDTLYIPWQLWAGDTAAPLPIVKHSEARAKAVNTVHDTLYLQTDKQVTFSQTRPGERKGIHSLRFIVLGIFVLLVLFYATRCRQ